MLGLVKHSRGVTAMYLFFDTETSDLPRSWTAPLSEVNNWPRIVQVAWITCDSEENIIECQTRLIKPDGFEIAAGAYQTHGISTEFARENGEALLPVLDELAATINSSSVLVAHNIDFDATIVAAEFIRSGRANPIASKTRHCTMKESTEYCQLPGNYGFKWPTLSELHTLLFGKDFKGAHDAAADCLACMNCYFRLKAIGIIG